MMSSLKQRNQPQMPKPTQQQAIVAFLTASDEYSREFNTRSNKYIVFSIHSDANHPKPRSLYVGRKGAVRVGLTTTKSRPIAEHLRQSWVDLGQKILSK